MVSGQISDNWSLDLKDIYEGDKNFYCSGDFKTCGFTIWKNNKYPATVITSKNVKELLSDGITSFKIKELDTSYTKKYGIDDTGKYVNFKAVQE